MLEVQKLSKLLIVRYTIAIVINVSFLLLTYLHHSVNIAINWYFDGLLQPYFIVSNITLYTINHKQNGQELLCCLDIEDTAWCVE